MVLPPGAFVAPEPAGGLIEGAEFVERGGLVVPRSSALVKGTALVATPAGALVETPAVAAAFVDVELLLAEATVIGVVKSGASARRLTM